MQRYVINGQFMCEKKSGIQRYAVEILKRVDLRIKQSDFDLELLVPFHTVERWRPLHIRLIKLNKRFSNLSKHIWLNFTLPRYAKRKKATIVNMCNMAPLFNSGIVCIHDIMYKTNPDFFSFKKRIVPRLYYYFETRFYKKIVTVSEYSKREICKNYKVSESDIIVIGNGWEHIKDIYEDCSILDRLGLKPNEYYVALGNISPHKNLEWVLAEAEKNIAYKFVIVGQQVLGLAKSNSPYRVASNVIFTGYISDEECKGLLAEAKGLLFPSYCEGFGIPPLEMLALGKPAIVSERTCLPEIFGDSVSYIDPDRNNYDLSVIESATGSTEEVLKNNSWDLSANKWLALLSSSSKN